MMAQKGEKMKKFETYFFVFVAGLFFLLGCKDSDPFGPFLYSFSFITVGGG